MKFETPSLRFSSSMTKKEKNNILLPATLACCGDVVKEKCIDHFSYFNGADH
jgi:hypothetical protein